MPTYQYRCTDCGEPLEVVQSFTDEPLTECPACQGRLRKVFSSVGIVFKGSGFYRTDSRDSASSKVGAGDKASDKGSDTAGDKSTASSSGESGSSTSTETKTDSGQTTKSAGSGSSSSSSSTTDSSAA